MLYIQWSEDNRLEFIKLLHYITFHRRHVHHVWRQAWRQKDNTSSSYEYRNEKNSFNWQQL